MSEHKAKFWRRPTFVPILILVSSILFEALLAWGLSRDGFQREDYAILGSLTGVLIPAAMVFYVAVFLRKNVGESNGHGPVNTQLTTMHRRLTDHEVREEALFEAINARVDRQEERISTENERLHLRFDALHARLDNFVGGFMGAPSPWPNQARSGGSRPVGTEGVGASSLRGAEASAAGLTDEAIGSGVDVLTDDDGLDLDSQSNNNGYL